MRPLSASELLDVWERGVARRSAERAVMLLAAASPGSTPEHLAQTPVGERDASLLTLREWTFGSRLIGLASCPGCGERLELVYDVADVRASPDARAAGEMSLTIEGYEVHFRLPNSLDLAAAADQPDVAAGRRLLLERCVLRAVHHGEERPADRLPPGVVDAMGQRMAQADPQGDVQLDLACPACSRRWQAGFDIAAFFWSEIDAWACRTLRNVHALASAYGWSETEILSMSPSRRQAYLEMVSG
jgi:hypothetical protein